MWSKARCLAALEGRLPAAVHRGRRLQAADPAAGDGRLRRDADRRRLGLRPACGGLRAPAPGRLGHRGHTAPRDVTGGSVPPGRPDLAAQQLRGAQPGDVHQPAGGLVRVGVRVIGQPVGERFPGADQGVRAHLEVGAVDLAPLGLHGPVEHAGDHVDDAPAHGGQLGGERLLPAGLPIEHGPAVAVGADEGEERPHARPHLVAQAEGGIDHIGDRLHQPGGLAAQAGDEQLLLGAQVGVDHGLGDAGDLGDLVHRGGVEAVPGEDAHGGVEHLLLTDLTGQTLEGASGRHPCQTTHLPRNLTRQ